MYTVREKGRIECKAGPIALIQAWLRQCHETSRIFTGTERIFASVDRGDVIFYRFVFEGKRDFWLFGRRVSSKSPKSQKDLFSRKRTVKMTFPPTLEKSASSREYLGSSVTLSRRGAKS